ncbi:hypothetical protein ACPA54_05725 [Uniformispora flossi]|uniref:Ogr/Delta-like zinc finger n=1 Tax=Yinghuangia aomiensis TaxID=676205 RepID=A0ABP9HDM5_9ACTN
MSEHCDACGRIEGPWHRTISRHTTSEGEIRYTRCLCGSVAVRLVPVPEPAAAAVLARTGPDAAVAGLLRGD